MTPLSGELGVISRKSLRQAICVLLVLCRICDIVEGAKTPPEGDPTQRTALLETLRQHHIEASMDDFNMLQQMMFLAPGQRLAYRTLFAGMYNCVSQVIYFHHPRFSRKPQLELARIPESPMHMLPLIRQLLPEIGIVYDDDSHVPGFMPAVKATPWTWISSCGAIFLMHTSSDASHHTIWRSADLAQLVLLYLQKSGQDVTVHTEDDAAPTHPVIITQASHVVLLP